MTTGAAVLLVAVALTLGFGAWRAGTDGRFRGGAPSDGPTGGTGTDAEGPQAGPTPAAAGVLRTGGALGEPATLLQFSSAFCAPCRATRRVLGDVADRVEAVRHVEVDAEQHLDATRELGVLRTPTTLVLDARGREVTRASGAPTTDQVLAAVGRAVP